MSNVAARHAGDRQLDADSPAGRILSAADFARLSASGQDGAKADIGQLPSFHEQAWQHGYRQGLRRVMSDIVSTLAELHACRRQRRTWMDGYVLSILRKILGESDAATLVPHIAQTVIENVDRSLETVAVHVHPDAVDATAKRIAALANKGAQIDIVSDERLAGTGCEIHTPFGILDAGLDTQLDALEHAILSADPVAADD